MSVTRPPDLPRAPSSIPLEKIERDLPGGPVVKTLPSNTGGASAIPGQGAKIPHTSRPKNKTIKQKQYCDKLNKDFKNGPDQKKERERRSKPPRASILTHLLQETGRERPSAGVQGPSQPPFPSTPRTAIMFLPKDHHHLAARSQARPSTSGPDAECVPPNS